MKKLTYCSVADQKKKSAPQQITFRQYFFFVDKKKIKKIDSLPPLPDGIILYPIDVVG